MLKDDLEKVIAEGNIEECSAVTIAQTIIDRLEIDIDQLWLKIRMNDYCMEKCKERHCIPYTCSVLAGYINKIMEESKPLPIKLKEGDK